jgi:DNA invertase Pin-like site-specific DNA recombinase
MKDRKTAAPLQSGADSDDRIVTGTIRHLVTMRESSGFDTSLMDGMIKQTMSKVNHLPGAVALGHAGVDVFRNPQLYNAHTTRRGGSRQVWVQVDDVLYFYSMGSAAKVDEKGDNFFVTELVDAIRTYKPKELWTVAFTRLVRSQMFAGALLEACEAHVRQLHCEVDIVTSTPEGKLIYSVLAMIAAAERDYIVRRHTAGRVIQWRRGNWIPIGMPPGYRRAADGSLEVDPDMVEPVREMLVLLADHSKSPRLLAREIGALGITTQKLRKRGLDVGGARNRWEVIRTLLGWAKTLEKGSYTVYWPNPFPGVDNVAGVEVVPAAPIERFPHGGLPLEYHLPVPEGGWASQEVFEAIRNRPRRRSGTGRHSSPLSGFFHTRTDTDETLMFAGQTEDYEVLRRPVGDREIDGWRNDPTVVRIARINRTALHSSIATAVIAAVQQGLPAELDRTRYSVGMNFRVDPRESERRELRRRVDELTTQKDRAKRNADLTSDEDSAAEFIRDYEQAGRELNRLERELERHTAVATDDRVLEFDSAAGLVVYAIAGLARNDTDDPRQLADSLRAVLSRETMTVDGPTVTWELCIDIPHDDGVVTLGPIRGTVPNLQPAPVKLPGARTATPPWMPNARKDLAAAGIKTLAASVAHASQQPDLVAVLVGDMAPVQLTHADWAIYVQATYRNPEFRWQPGKWQLDDERRQHLVDLLVAAGAKLAVRDLKAAGFTTNEIKHLRANHDVPDGHKIVRITSKGSRATAFALDCPHCGSPLDIVKRVPEVPHGVLCSNCRRSPDRHSPTFPNFYFDHRPDQNTHGIERQQPGRRTA